MSESAGWVYWIAGQRHRRDDLGRDVEWAEVQLYRSRGGGGEVDEWQRFEQPRASWRDDGPPPSGPVEQVDEAEADRLLDTWVAMRMSPGRPLPPREEERRRRRHEPRPWKGDLLRRLQLGVLAAAAVVVLVRLVFS